MAAQHGLNERIQVAVHHVLNIAGLYACAQIFHHLIRLENIGTDLVATPDVSLLTVLAVGIRLLLVFLNLV